ncbi:alpha/beta fold hydrolase [Cellulomonas alba]|uniref:Alpha/beta hydrolase n=1 Tax=Cellulomonas alba TaxID=3053467 RepID=A0ABT7SHD5_9CELL|nr:alpha/beta hydrolase [Cellulomonas alba]MDM7855608.1 alpha/beta hydrolase [Cellulomonas alba]
MTQYLQRPEGRIAYDLTGPADAPLVVLVPGMGDLRGTWRDIAEPLAAAGHRVAAMDLRGHGDSDTTFTTHGDVVTGQDVLALVDELGGPAVLVGSSMGAGSVAWAAAERPSAVAGLVLTGPFLRNPPTGGLTVALTKLLYRALFARPWGAGAWTGYYRKTLSRGAKAPWFDEHVAAVHASMSRPANLRSFRHLCVQLTHAPVEKRLGEVQAPAIAFLGERDPDFADPAAEGAWIGRRLGAEVVMLSDVAHYPQHQAGEQVAERTLAFLAALPRDARGFAVAERRGPSVAGA